MGSLVERRLRETGQCSLGIALVALAPLVVLLGLSTTGRLPSGKSGVLTLAAPLVLGLWWAFIHTWMRHGLTDALFLLAMIGTPIAAGILFMASFVHAVVLYQRCASWLRGRGAGRH